LKERFRKRAAGLAQADFVLKGSVVQRFLPCGTASCHCHADPPQLHGPYWQWSTRVNGKTVTRMLTADQARRYHEWMKNWKQMEKILEDMHALSTQAADLLLAQDRDSGRTHTLARRRTKPTALRTRR
jgi:hypothetical protein